MDDRIKVKFPEGNDDHLPPGAGHAEVLQPATPPLPNGLTVEGQIAAMGLIAEAAVNEDPRKRTNRRAASLMILIGTGMFVVPVMIIIGLAQLLS